MVTVRCGEGLLCQSKEGKDAFVVQMHEKLQALFSKIDIFVSGLTCGSIKVREYQRACLETVTNL